MVTPYTEYDDLMQNLLPTKQDSGGPCVADEEGIFGAAYEECYQALLKEYITATALCSMVACLLMGGWANLPLILAPGMGVNAYFTYGVVGKDLFRFSHVLCARLRINLTTFSHWIHVLRISWYRRYWL